LSGGCQPCRAKFKSAPRWKMDLKTTKSNTTGHLRELF
jgi:hypothetical protein